MNQRRSIKNSRRFFFVIIALLILLGCQSAEKEKAFRNLYPGVDFNREVVLVTSPAIDSDGNVTPDSVLVLENHSSEIISYNSLDGTILYTYLQEKKEWVQLKSLEHYYSKPTDDILYPKRTRNAIYLTFIDAVPGLNDYTAPVVVRVVAIGHQMNDGKPVGAYYDWIMLPYQ
jgi:hypothetical protein